MLAVAGSLLIWNGVNRRFKTGSDRPNQTASESPLNVEASSYQEGAIPRIVVRGLDFAPLHPVEQAQHLDRQDLSLEAHPTTEKSVDAPGTITKSPPQETIRTDRPDLTGLITDTPTPLKDPHKRLLIDWLAGFDWSDTEIAQLRRHLSDPRAAFRPEVLKVNVNHVESEDLYTQHLTSESVEMCLEFWETQGKKITTAAAPDKIPPEIILSILKVETNLGKYPGRESVFNVYWSLSLADNPRILNEILPQKGSGSDDDERKRLKRRAAWARSQLRDLLYMSRRGTGVDPLGTVGSWAGAFGLPQFIPTSYRAYGRDGNGDGVIDLDDIEDAVASIAHYLEVNGWPKGKSLKRQRKALLRYNHSTFYADCILALSDSLSHRLNGLQPIQ